MARLCPRQLHFPRLHRHRSLGLRGPEDPGSLDEHDPHGPQRTGQGAQGRLRLPRQRC